MKIENNIQTLKYSASECCLAFASFFVNFSLGLLIKVLLIKQKTYNIIKPFGNMFRRKVRSGEMKRYTLLDRTDQEILDLLKIGSLQELYNFIFHIAKSSFKLNQADMQND